MRTFPIAVLTAVAAMLLLTAVPSAPAEVAAAPEYHIEMDPNIVNVFREKDGKSGLFITVQFKVRRGKDGPLADDVKKDDIVVKEDGKLVADLEIIQPTAGGLTTVLVLDHSGSMAEKASDGDTKSKIQALRQAASHFVEKMPANTSTTLLPFSSTLDKPRPFSGDKERLYETINKLKPEGGTLLYDAVWSGVETLAASGREGNKAVVVLTDGYDEAPGSRRTDRDAIDAAREARIPLHLLGLGRPHEVNEPVMKQMAKETGGSYHNATNQQELYDLFGNLSEQLQATYTVTFRSLRSKDDGTARAIDISVVHNGRLVSDVASGDYNRHGVVVPEMDHRVYLVILALLGVLLAAPAGFRKLLRLYGGR